MNTTPARPTGITILAVLAAIGGVFSLLAAFTVGLLGFFWTILFLVSAIFDFAFAYFAWTLQPLGWMLGIVAEGVAVLVALINLIAGGGFGNFLVSLIIAGAIVYYLFTPAVKQAFGRP